MTESSFLEVARVLDAWPDLPAPSRVLPPPYQRLRDALYLSAARPGSVGVRDLVALVRQVLRHETAAQGANQHLLVPGAAGWPTAGQWEDATCSAQPATAGRLLVTAAAWTPPWGGGAPVMAAAEAAALRRLDERQSGDPFLADVLGPAFTHYSSPGQRQAIRTVLAAGHSATVIVNLPTGSGKSAVAIAPALLHSAVSGVSVVVVPTTSLALDQERAVRAHLTASEPGRAHPARFAYFGGQSEPERARASATRSGPGPSGCSSCHPNRC